MLNYFDVIKAQSGIPVKDIWAQLWGNTISSKYVITTYTGTLPATLTGTEAGYLESYKIYGNTESGKSVGERTENLFDINKLHSSITVEGESFTKPDSGYNFDIFSGTSGSSKPIDENKSMFLKAGEYVATVGEHSSTINIARVNGNEELAIIASISATQSSLSFTLNYDSYVTVRISKSESLTISNLEISAGLTIPTRYEPYGYKLPMVVTNGTTTTTTPIYIGSNPLAEDEYVDFGEQKIYHMEGGTLTPTDPPVPISALPTIEGETIIDWDGSGLAPSQVELKYKARR